jgi:uncharacterized membrane protein
MLSIFVTMKDTTAISVQGFKNQFFLWEVVITVLVFVSIYYFLKAFKKKETEAKTHNQRFEKFED